MTHQAHSTCYWFPADSHGLEYYTVPDPRHLALCTIKNSGVHCGGVQRSFCVAYHAFNGHVHCVTVWESDVLPCHTSGFTLARLDKAWISHPR